MHVHRILEFVPIVLMAALGVAALRFSRRGRRIAGGDPHCATCGYIVRGLPGVTCPECGADLSRPGGIAYAGGRRPAGTLSRLIGWSAFCLLAVGMPLAFVWWTFLVPRLPHGRDVVQDLRFTVPASGAYQSIGIKSHARGTLRLGAADPTPSTFGITLTTKDGTAYPINVDAGTLAYRYVDKGGQVVGGAPVDARVLEDWLIQAGITGDRQKIAGEMKFVEHEVRAISMGRPTGQINHYPEFSGRSSSGSMSTWDLPWVPFVPAAVGGAVWLIGLIVILSRAGRAHSPVAPSGVSVSS